MKKKLKSLWPVMSRALFAFFGLLGVFADCGVDLLHQCRVISHASILFESCDADLNGGRDLITEVSSQFRIAKRHPDRFRDLNIDCDIALLLREPESCDSFRPKCPNRPIDSQNQAILVNRGAMGPGDMSGKCVIQGNLAASHCAGLRPASLATYRDVV